ncbi:MAG: SRPBCC family protein [Calothrix sp. C42_A2020_038]|nr:SRPBCC family protein [Calothrix sp. C42_A2020_038]
MTQQYYSTEDFDSDQNNKLTADVDELQSIEVVIEKIAERKRKITSKIQILRPPETVWEVLTNYEALAEFIPNLTKSQRLEHPQGGIRLEQVGQERLLKFNFNARVVIDLFEVFPKEINFQMVEGDFKEYSGSWHLLPCFDSQSSTNLCYTLFVHPKRMMPVGIIEQRLSNGLKVNLLAIKKYIESLAQY